MSYVTVTALKQYRKENADSDTASDAVLQSAIDAAEASINDICQRCFALVGTSETRTFAYNSDGTVSIADAVTVTHINGVALDPDLHQLEPLSSRTGQFRPFTQIRAYSGWAWNRWGTVTVTGTFGWPSIPPQIYEACKILARDILANRDVAFGIAGFAEYGAVVVRTNKTVSDLIAPFRTVHAFGIA